MIRANGFTLVELLAAMVAGSILLITLGWVTGILGREVRPSDSEREALRVAHAAPVIGRLVGSALAQDKGGARLDITPTTISSIVAPPAALGTVGPLRMDLAVKKEPEGDALYLTLAPAEPSASLPAAATDPVKLTEGFASIRFEPVDLAGQLAPQAVRLIFKGNATRTFVAATNITSSGACRFDPISATCR